MLANLHNQAIPWWDSEVSWYLKEERQLAKKKAVKKKASGRSR